MTSNVQSSSSAADTTQTTQTSSSSSTTISKDMFLQLLIAQLKYQDPLNPTDSTAFMTQLAQIQQIEQSMNVEKDVEAILAGVERIAPSEVASS
jgi:flagellar basal-body rod modification protein FlgD